MSTNIQILKSRDDKDPVLFQSAGEEGRFQLVEGAACSWMKPDEKFGPKELRPRIEPWLTALFQSEHFALLAGSGLSQAIYHIATGKSLPGMSKATFSHYNSEITEKAKESATKAGREEGNIEDQIRVANELLCGLEILSLLANMD